MDVCLPPCDCCVVSVGACCSTDIGIIILWPFSITQSITANHLRMSSMDIFNALLLFWLMAIHAR